MAQMGFFDLTDRYASLDAKKDPLVEIDAVVPWEEIRPTLERVWRKPAAARKSRAGRKPMDAVLMFKTLVLSALYNLSDDQIEYQVRDRLSFMRFLGLEDRVPDAKTVWLYREALAQAGKVEGCSASSTAIWRGRATSRAAVKSWMRPSCRCRATTTRGTRTRQSRTARCPRTGRTSPRSARKRTWTRAGRKSTARGPDHRLGSSDGQDRDEEPRLQHAPPRPAAPSQPVPGVSITRTKKIRPRGRKIRA